jgi:TolB-like protein/Tfp pilus assembly protein PilF
MTDLFSRIYAILTEFKARHVFRVAVVYAVVSWIVVEPAATIFPILGLPKWTVTLIVILVLLGFPIALVLAWAFEITPEGVRRVESVELRQIELPPGVAKWPERHRHRSRQRILITLILVLFVASIWPAWWFWLRPQVLVKYQDKIDTTVVAEKKTLQEPVSFKKLRIAVLPFDNFSPATEDEYFADGMTEELISTLSVLGDLRVIARTSVMRYKGTDKSVAEIGRELKVGTVLEGSFRKAGDKMRIAVHLIDVQSQVPLWSHQYDRDFRDVFAIQSDVAKQVAKALEVHLVTKEKSQIEKKKTDNLEAYNLYLKALYLKGRYHWNKRTEGEVKKGIKYFEQAIKEDPNYAEAYSGLADSYILLGYFGTLRPEEAYRRAKEAALEALKRNDTLAEAHVSLAYAKYAYDWDWSGAEREFRRAIELNPSYATAHHWYAWYLTTMGRHDEAIAAIKRAEDLDPLSLIIRVGVGWLFYYARQYEHAIAQYLKTLEMDANFVLAHCGLALAYQQKGWHKEAIAELQEAVNLSNRSPFTLALFGHAHGVTGNRQEAQTLLKELNELSKRMNVPAFYMAAIHTGLDEPYQAFQWLERAYGERSEHLVYLRVDPMFDTLRSDPRYASLMQRVGLPRQEHE